MTKPIKNQCGKTRPVENPYEIWENPLSGFVFSVLKKYQRPDKEADNPDARWFVATKSPNAVLTTDFVAFCFNAVEINRLMFSPVSKSSKTALFIF